MSVSTLQQLLNGVASGSEAVFPKYEYDRRTRRLQALMRERGFDLLLLTGAENIFYLTGQQTPGYYTFQCLSVPVEGEFFHVIRELEAMNARANTYLADIVGYDDGDDPAVVLGRAIKERGWGNKCIAIDQSSWFLTVNLFNRLRAELGVLSDGSGLVERLRRVKSRLEIEQMDQASAANDAGMKAGIAATGPGATENDVAAAIMQASIAAGGEYVGMEPFVTTGPRSGIPHTTWRRRRIEHGDVVILETAACYNRYHAARFQTLFVGQAPELAEVMYDACEEALGAALDKLKPGNTCADAHHATQAVIDRRGFTAGYRKRAGYSMGISFAPDWGEGNVLSLYHNVDVELEPGMVFHVPITLREYGRFTVAASETVAITDDGNRILSALPRALIRL